MGREFASAACQSSALTSCQTSEPRSHRWLIDNKDGESEQPDPESTYRRGGNLIIQKYSDDLWNYRRSVCIAGLYVPEN